MNKDIKKPGIKRKSPPKKGKAGLIIIIILVLVIGGLMAVFAFNLFGFRESVVMPYLRNAPLFGGLFPAPEEEDETIPLEQRPPQELADMIRAHEREIARLEEMVRVLSEQAQVDTLQIARLRPFHDHWDEYQRVSAEFNAMIARGAPEAFLDRIRDIMPEFYEQLARDSMHLRDHLESVLTVVRTLGNMQAKNAAELLVDLRSTDPELLANVLVAMGNELRGEILNEMDPPIAAAMIRLIHVQEPTLSPLAPSLFTPVLPETLEDIEPEEDEPEEDLEDGEESD
jgi:hypothetical protein